MLYNILQTKKLHSIYMNTFYKIKKLSFNELNRRIDQFNGFD